MSARPECCRGSPDRLRYEREKAKLARNGLKPNKRNEVVMLKILNKFMLSRANSSTAEMLKRGFHQRIISKKTSE